MKFPSLNEQLDVIRKGVVEIIPEEELIKKLERSIEQSKPLKVKLGCDPSSSDLHIGHAVILNKMREFQDLGHEVTLIIGDFTAMIGDPTGKKKTRPQLSFDEARRNGETYLQQATKVLDVNKTKFVYNSEWLSKLTIEDLIKVLGKFTLQRIIERDDFTNRLRDHQEISLHEILYPIMQGYDSYVIKSDIELGGTDQKFNNLIGRDMQKRFNEEPQIVITMPLLEGTDGTEKMSKSLNNYVGITDTPQDIFGKIMSIPDLLIYKYFELATRLTPTELASIKKELENPTTNPRDIKRKLGLEIVKLYYDEAAAHNAIEEFDKLFIKKEIPDEIPEFKTKKEVYKLVNLLKEAGLIESNSAARRLIQQGGVSIDGERISDVNHEVKLKSGMTVKLGKRKFIKIVIS